MAGSVPRPVYAVYRMCSLGVALTDTLQHMVDTDQLSETEAMQVLFQFDKSINKLLPRHVSADCTMTGQLNSYRYRDQVWQLYTKNIRVRYTDAQLAYKIGNATPQQAIRLIDQQLQRFAYRLDQLKQLRAVDGEAGQRLSGREEAQIEVEVDAINAEIAVYSTLRSYVQSELSANSAATHLSSKLQQAIYDVSEKTLCLNAEVQRNENNEPIVDARGRKLITSLKIAACELPRARFV